MAAVPMPLRRRVYLVGLLAGIGAWTALALYLGVQNRVPGVQALFLASGGLAIVALRWLRPRPRLYLAGVACMLLFCALGLLLGPEGEQRVKQVLPDADYRSPAVRAVGVVVFASFPLGWQLLAWSVGRWWTGPATYLGAGLLFWTMLGGPIELLRFRYPISGVLRGLAYFAGLWWGWLMTWLYVFGWRDSH